MKDRMGIRAELSVWRDAVEIYAWQDAGDGRFVARSAEFVKVEEGAIFDPVLRMRSADAQLLMDELWRAGLRPTEGTGSAGSLAATERHLGDMRTIAFKLLQDEQALADASRQRGVQR